MSHFCTMVIGDDVENQLSPFEEKEVDRYVKYTKEELIEKQRKEINEYKNNFYDEYLKDPVTYENECLGNHSHLKYLKEEFPKKLLFTDEELYKEAIKYEEMEDIGDNGELYSTYNPNSKWDWYQVGGRWSKMLKTKNENYVNIAKKKNILNLKEITSFALVIDGKWYEKGKMGWWGLVSDKKEENEWEEEFRKLIDNLPNETLITIVDCHI